jgi:hypothetical protein
MARTTVPFGLAAIATLAVAGSAGALPLKPPATHPHPTMHVPPLPGLRSIPPEHFYRHSVNHRPQHVSTLQDALRDLHTARGEVSDRSQPNFTAALGKVEAAEHIVSRDKHAASEHKDQHRADSLGSILKSIQDASHHVAGHRGNESRDALERAAKELDGFLHGKKPPAAKKPKN